MSMESPPSLSWDGLARWSHTKLSCRMVGSRPIDLHLEDLEAMGTELVE